MEEPKNDRIKLRETLCPSIGYLYPMYYHLLKNTESLEDMRGTLRGFSGYNKILNEVPEPNWVTDNY